MKNFGWILLLLLASCHKNLDETDILLNKELEIMNKYRSELDHISEKFKEAEKLNQLQNQIDLRRKLDSLIDMMNNELENCSERNPEGIKITFENQADRAKYKVFDVRTYGCRINPNSLHVETYITAKIKIENTTDNSFPASLIDNDGKKLTDIKFSFTNDYPEQCKTVTVIAHPNNFYEIKNFSKIKFY